MQTDDTQSAPPTKEGTHEETIAMLDRIEIKLEILLSEVRKHKKDLKEKS